jgi:hypothetical protein
VQERVREDEDSGLLVVVGLPSQVQWRRMQGVRQRERTRERPIGRGVRRRGARRARHVLREGSEGGVVSEAKR